MNNLSELLTKLNQVENIKSDLMNAISSYGYNIDNNFSNFPNAVTNLTADATATTDDIYGENKYAYGKGGKVYGNLQATKNYTKATLTSHLSKVSDISGIETGFNVTTHNLYDINLAITQSNFKGEEIALDMTGVTNITFPVYAMPNIRILKLYNCQDATYISLSNVNKLYEVELHNCQNDKIQHIDFSGCSNLMVAKVSPAVAVTNASNLYNGARFLPIGGLSSIQPIGPNYYRAYAGLNMFGININFSNMTFPENSNCSTMFSGSYADSYLGFNLTVLGGRMTNVINTAYMFSGFSLPNCSGWGFNITNSVNCTGMFQYVNLQQTGSSYSTSINGVLNNPNTMFLNAIINRVAFFNLNVAMKGNLADMFSNARISTLYYNTTPVTFLNRFTIDNATNLCNAFRNVKGRYDNGYGFTPARNTTQIIRFNGKPDTAINAAFAFCNTKIYTSFTSTYDNIGLGIVFSNMNVSDMNSFAMGWDGFRTFVGLNTSKFCSLTNAFNGCTNMTTMDSCTLKASEILYTFKNCANLHNFNNFNIEFNADSSIVFRDTFQGCSKLAALPNMINIPKVVGMYNVFQDCTTINNTQFLDMIQTDFATDISMMYYGCTNLKDVSGVVFPNATNMYASFAKCNNLTNESVQNIINMVLNSKITTASYMNLATTNAASPLYDTKFDNTYYADRLAELDAIGWTY